MKAKQIFSLDKELLKALQKEADKTKLKKSAIASIALEEYLNFTPTLSRNKTKQNEKGKN